MCQYANGLRVNLRFKYIQIYYIMNKATLCKRQ